MNISDKEELGKLRFKLEKLQREYDDLQDSLTKQKIINKSELALNHDLKQMIETMKLQSNSLLDIIEHYSKKLINYQIFENVYIDFILIKMIF